MDNTAIAIIIGVILVLMAVLLGVFLLINYNQFRLYQAQLASAQSNVEANLNKRFSVLGHLIEFVKGYMRHENKTLRQVIEERSKAMASKDEGNYERSNAILSNNAGKVFTLTEKYPDLKADERFKNLEQQLVQLEDDIYYARNFYNTVVQDLRFFRDVFSDCDSGLGTGNKKAEFFQGYRRGKTGGALRFFSIRGV